MGGCCRTYWEPSACLCCLRELPLPPPHPTPPHPASHLCCLRELPLNPPLLPACATPAAAHRRGVWRRVGGGSADAHLAAARAAGARGAQGQVDAGGGRGAAQGAVGFEAGRRLDGLMGRWHHAGRAHRGGLCLPPDIPLLSCPCPAMCACAQAMAMHGRKWSQVAKLVPGRTDVQCRERYMNVLNPGGWLGGRLAALGGWWHAYVRILYAEWTIEPCVQFDAIRQHFGECALACTQAGTICLSSAPTPAPPPPLPLQTCTHTCPGPQSRTMTCWSWRSSTHW